jgi:DNA-binding MarR family transcriptional regulator
MKKRKKSDSGNSPADSRALPAQKPAGWTFLTNHTHVLLCLYRNSEITLREVAVLVGITERMVQKIVAELVEAGYLEVTRVGRRNTYLITLDRKLRHPLESHRSIGDMLDNLSEE